MAQVSPSKVYNQSAYMLFYTRDVDAPKPQPMVKEPAPEALFLPNGDTYSSPGHRSKPEHPVPTPEGGACEPSSRPMDWHAFAHCAPRAMIERTFSSPAALVRRGNAMGSCSPGSQDSPNGLPVVSTSSSGSLDGELCPATKDTASYSLMGPGAVGTLGDGLVAEVADRLAEDLMLASRPGSGSLKDRCPEHTEAMAVQEEVEPSYEIRTIQDHAGGAQLLKLIVDLPGIKVRRECFAFFDDWEMGRGLIIDTRGHKETARDGGPGKNNVKRGGMERRHCPLKATSYKAARPCRFQLVVADCAALVASQAQDVDLAIDDAGSILPDAPGSSCFAGSSYLSITVIGKYFLRLPLPPGVMTSEHPAKYNSRSGRLKMTLVGTAQPDEVGAGGLGEGAGGNLSGPVPASTTEDIRLQPQKCRGRSSSCNDLETFNSSQGYEKDEV